MDLYMLQGCALEKWPHNNLVEKEYSTMIIVDKDDSSLIQEI